MTWSLLARRMEKRKSIYSFYAIWVANKVAHCAWLWLLFAITFSFSCDWFYTCEENSTTHRSLSERIIHGHKISKLRPIFSLDACLSRWPSAQSYTVAPSPLQFRERPILLDIRAHYDAPTPIQSYQILMFFNYLIHRVDVIAENMFENNYLMAYDYTCVLSNKFINISKYFQTFSLVNKRMGKKVFFRFSKEKSLFFLSYTNPIRRFCIRLICTQWFDHFIIAVILINCVLLAADTDQPYIE